MCRLVIPAQLRLVRGLDEKALRIPIALYKISPRAYELCEISPVAFSSANAHELSKNAHDNERKLAISTQYFSYYRPEAQEVL